MNTSRHLAKSVARSDRVRGGLLLWQRQRWPTYTAVIFEYLPFFRFLQGEFFERARGQARGENIHSRATRLGGHFLNNKSVLNDETDRTFDSAKLSTPSSTFPTNL